MIISGLKLIISGLKLIILHHSESVKVNIFELERKELHPRRSSLREGSIFKLKVPDDEGCTIAPSVASRGRGAPAQTKSGPGADAMGARNQGWRQHRVL